MNAQLWRKVGSGLGTRLLVPHFFHIARVGEPGVDLRRKVAEFASSHKNEAVFSLNSHAPLSHTTVTKHLIPQC